MIIIVYMYNHIYMCVCVWYGTCMHISCTVYTYVIGNNTMKRHEGVSNSAQHLIGPFRWRDRAGRSQWAAPWW